MLQTPKQRIGRRIRRARRGGAPFRLAVYGICHADALQRMLAADPRCAGEVEVVPLTECFKMDAEEISAFEREIAPTLDALIYQPVAGLNLGERFSAAAITSHLRRDCLTISFPIIHFDLYTPLISYPAPGAPRPPFGYLDFAIVSQFLAGVSAATARVGSDFEIGDHQVQAIKDWSIDELVAREVAELGPVDIAIASLVRERMADEVLFHTINHPGPTIMRELLEQVVERLWTNGIIARKDGGADAVDPFSRIHFPAHPSVQRVLGLTDDSRFIHDHKAVSDSEAVARTYDYLTGCDREVVVASMDRILESRPWYGELLDAFVG